MGFTVSEKETVLEEEQMNVKEDYGGDGTLEIVNRTEWCARPPKAVEAMHNPVPFVVIHHSYIPPACLTKKACVEAMQWMQDYHQYNHSWNDIGYSFAVGSDGRAYVGRGWSAVGAHAPTYNNKSIGICVIGDWRVELPPARQLETVKQLIRLGVRLGKISEDYMLITHRQVREGTECPGDRLFQEVSTWDHFHAGPLKKYKKVATSNAAAPMLLASPKRA